MWQECGIMTFETENVTIRKCKLNKIGTTYIHDPKIDTIKDSEKHPRTAGVVYPKNSTNILIEDLYISNCSNHIKNVAQLHGFYCTRLENSTIQNCILKNISGSPVKFRRQPRAGGPNNVRFINNECYYTGHTPDLRQNKQPGFIRFSGENKGFVNCPSEIYIENNIFYYPFCYEGQNCETMDEQILLSNSNVTVCGDANTNGRVIFKDNDIRFKWVDPSLDTPIIIDDKANNAIKINLQILDTHIDISGIFASETKIQIFNLTGKLILATSIEKSEGEQNHQIDVSQLNAGMYMVHIANQNTNRVEKIIVN